MNMTPYDFLVNFGFALMLLGFILRDVLKLRVALVLGQACVVAYNFHRGVIPPFLWNGLYMCINAVWVVRIVRERRSISIPADIKDIYEKVFTAFSPQEFLSFWNSGIVKGWGGDIVVRTDETPKEMFLIVGGVARVERDGRTLTTLERGRFFAEMSFLTGQPSSADIRGDGNLRVIAWPQEKLREMKESKPALFMKLQCILGCDLAAKLREANERE
jgi:hypothetical protein